MQAVLLARNEMKNNKTPEDEIISEMLKTFGKTLIDMLTKTVNRIEKLRPDTH